MPPGGSVVSCTSSDSPVASLPFSTSRICAPCGVRTGSFSNGYTAEGIDSSCVADASDGRIAGISIAGSIEHNSRRVTGMAISFGYFQIIVEALRTNSLEKLLDFETKNL